MERLTHERCSGIKDGYWSPAKKDQLIERLAAYEDTGLMPEEIVGLRNKACEWIPCTDRMPDNEDKVLCCTQTKTGSKNIVLGYYADGWRCGMNSNVIAWMPLPEVPDDFANAGKKVKDDVPMAQPERWMEVK